MTSKTWLASLLPLAAVLGGGMVYDYRLPQAPRSGDLNRGRTWEHKSRVDGKGIEQVWVPPGCFAAAGGFTNRGYWSDEGWRAHEGRREPYPILRQFDYPRQPRVKLTWYEAEAYARWRGGRLPTEAQWEWAARGPESRKYPWGERFFDGAANMDHLDLRCTRPAGSYPAGRSWCGGDDMAGNAWEWVADGYDRYAYRFAAAMDPYTPRSRARRA